MPVVWFLRTNEFFRATSMILKTRLWSLSAAMLVFLRAAPLWSQSSASAPPASNPGTQSVSATVGKQPRAPRPWQQHVEVTLQMTGNFNRDTSSSTVAQSSINTGGVLAGIRYYQTPHLAFELNVAHDKDTFEYTTLQTGLRQGLQSETNELNLNLVYVLPYLRTLHPFALIGGRLLNFGPSNQTNVTVANARVQDRGAFTFGFGSDVRLSPHWSIRAQLR